MESLDRNVLDLILSLALEAPSSLDDSPGATLRALGRQAASLCSVCRAFNHAARGGTLLWKRAALLAGVPLPRRLFVGATHRSALSVLAAVLREEERAEAEQRELRLKPTPMMACGMRMAPGTESRGAHPKSSFGVWSGLNASEGARVQQHALELLEFLRSFSASQPHFQAPAALARYRMFLELRREHPNSLLLPTADILFAQLAHTFRTELLWSDGCAATPWLSKEEHPLYNEAAQATARLWQERFKEPYVDQDIPLHVFWASQKGQHPGFDGFKPHATYSSPPSYLPLLGPAPSGKHAGVAVSLTAEDLVADLQWMPELQKQFRELRRTAYHWMYQSHDKAILERLFQSYQRFLYLVAKYPEQQLAPPVTIDLMWHAHQTSAQLYKEETTRVVGFHLLHDPWPEEGGVKQTNLRPVQEQLQCLWKTEFQVELNDDHRYETTNTL